MKPTCKCKYANCHLCREKAKWDKTAMESKPQDGKECEVCDEQFWKLRQGMNFCWNCGKARPEPVKGLAQKFLQRNNWDWDYFAKAKHWAYETLCKELSSIALAHFVEVVRNQNQCLLCKTNFNKYYIDLEATIKAMQNSVTPNKSQGGG